MTAALVLPLLGGVRGGFHVPPSVFTHSSWVKASAVEANSNTANNIKQGVSITILLKVENFILTTFYIKRYMRMYKSFIRTTCACRKDKRFVNAHEIIIMVVNNGTIYR